ncbi:MAG: hypothetical protein LBS70_01410 [Candidatus Accumulibacter sp.]|nr:hypothetical protein [Accumulibacter sp.]
MKITKESIASRYQAFGPMGGASYRVEAVETEPVHTVVADRETPDYERLPGGQEQKPARPGAPSPWAAVETASAPVGEERRKGDRRKRQVPVLLDTRVTPSRRQRLVIDERA